eukprot:EC796748.1.p4 GENE.EC796748.1~~EC796748.1.p4  ORF type:complete len:52 (-),score=0.91 EC796748.1:364-519(-)
MDGSVDCNQPAEAALVGHTKVRIRVDARNVNSHMQCSTVQVHSQAPDMHPG